jgi:hypothetical protein
VITLDPRIEDHLMIDHLVYAAPDLTAAIADVTERLLNALAGGLVPFLISWGDTEHPARLAPRGLTLDAFHLEHPDPASLAPLLTPSARMSRSGRRPRPRSSPASAARTAASCCDDRP